MGEFKRLLGREQRRELAAEGDRRWLGQQTFEKWRDHYVANLCGYIRTYAAAEREGVKLPPPYRSPEWCNAAVQILTIADAEIQDHFMRALESGKDAMVAAVLQDGYVIDFDGRQVELPAL